MARRLAASSPTLPADGAPSEVMERLMERMVSVRSVWFPTPRELRAWQASGHPLYVRRTGGRTLEVGPRLGSMWASCFSPVDRLRLDEGSAEVVGRRFPRMTVGVLVVWWVVTGLWGLAELPLVASGELHPSWLVFFGLLALSSTVGPLLGWRKGGDWLDEHRHWLEDALRTADHGEDW